VVDGQLTKLSAGRSKKCKKSGINKANKQGATGDGQRTRHRDSSEKDSQLGADLL